MRNPGIVSDITPGRCNHPGHFRERQVLEARVSGRIKIRFRRPNEKGHGIQTLRKFSKVRPSFLYTPATRMENDAIGSRTPHIREFRSLQAQTGQEMLACRTAI